jgi:POT family proton-dependent oligopeptide transporter
MPSGIPFIIGNEAAERFSFYGMKGILFVFMTQYLLAADGSAAPMSEPEAKSYYHLFVSAAYFFPVLGAILADLALGKYRTILYLSVVYCFGHLALALDETRLGLFAGLILIAIGSGGIKPCVSAHVGDQFGELNKHLLEKVYSWFYFSINLGAFISTLLTPVLLHEEGYGPRWAFGVPGVLMLLATIVFWLGRNRFVHIPPAGGGFLREIVSPEGLSVIARLSLIYVFVAIFWALYDQTGSAWVQQAEKMDRVLFHPESLQWLPATLRESRMLSWLSREWLPSQIQAVNPVLILAYIPLFAYGIYPALDKVFRLTPLRKVSIGLFLTVAGFAISGWIETRIVAGQVPSMWWQVLAYMVITAAEVMVSITCLEFSYTQAPPQLKSFVMSLYLLSVSLGNALTSAVNIFIQNKNGSSKLEGASYYWFFTGLMFVAACSFIIVAWFYKERTYLQEMAPAGEHPAGNPA